MYMSELLLHYPEVCCLHVETNQNILGPSRQQSILCQNDVKLFAVGRYRSGLRVVIALCQIYTQKHIHPYFSKEHIYIEITEIRYLKILTGLVVNRHLLINNYCGFLLHEAEKIGSVFHCYVLISRRKRINNSFGSLQFHFLTN